MTQLPEQPRLFVAVELDGRVQEALSQLRRDLQSHAVRGLRWVRPEGIHLTLKFLGETPRDRLAPITEALSTSTVGVPPHSLTLGKLGTFGSRNAPRVLWLDLEGDLELLLRLQEQVERALKSVGYPAEKRRFSPHLTLARVRPEDAAAVASPLAEAVTATRTPKAEIEVRELSLMLSSLNPAGAVYTRLEAFPLTG